jgi:Raf kinase inhibitor-like YbhB/YbcL family protein
VPAGDNNGFQIISPVFRDGAAIPRQYTCKGQNVNPPLNIFNVPPKAQGLALILHDPDAVSGDYLHWLVWDIPPGTESIAVNDVPVGAIQGRNGSGQNIYAGPCPPKGTGTHHYLFDFYALDISANLPSGATRDELETAMKGHVIEKATLTGLFAAEA